MPRRNRIFLKALLPLGLLVVAAFASVRRRGDDWEYEQDDPVTEETPPVFHVAGRRPAARFALVAAFTMLFFAGASFTAGAGDKMARLLDEDAAALAESSEITAGTESTEAAPADAEAQPAEAAPAEAAPAAEPAASEPAAAAEPAAEAAAPSLPILRQPLRRTLTPTPRRRSSRRPAAEQAASNLVGPDPAAHG